MTLHITTFTPTHVITTCDRLLYTPSGYIELPDDRYKHFVIECRGDKAVVSFAGLAGIVKTNSDGSEVLVDGTIDWLTDLAGETSRTALDIFSYINQFRSCAQPHIDSLSAKYDLAKDDMQLAIQICGWNKHTQFLCLIHNCLNLNADAVETRNSFTTHTKYFDEDSFKSRPYEYFLLGQRSLATKQPFSCEIFRARAATGDPKTIFAASVALIRSIAGHSPDTIGTNCSGMRLTRDDPFDEPYDDRPGTILDVMPNVVHSTQRFSLTIKDITIKIG